MEISKAEKNDARGRKKYQALWLSLT